MGLVYLTLFNYIWMIFVMVYHTVDGSEIRRKKPVEGKVIEISLFTRILYIPGGSPEFIYISIITPCHKTFEKKKKQPHPTTKSCRVLTQPLHSPQPSLTTPINAAVSSKLRGGFGGTGGGTTPAAVADASSKPEGGRFRRRRGEREWSMEASKGWRMIFPREFS